MLLRRSDLDMMEKYLVPVGENTYRLKDIPLPSAIRERLLELDELQVLSYGEHMIEDYDKL